MPQTVAGLSFLVLIGLPGIVFLAVRESREAARDLSALREAANAIGAGVVCDAIVVSVLGLARAQWPDATPNFGALVRGGTPYLERHYVSFGWWGVGSVVLGCVIAAMGAVVWVGVRESTLGKTFTRSLRRFGPKIRNESGWAASFKRHPETDVFVGIELLDGSYVYGALDSYSPQGDETSDRSIVLAEPIDMRRPWMPSPDRLDARTFVIAADQIRFITTYYLPPPVEAEAA